LTTAAQCTSAVAKQQAWLSREECCLMNYDFFSPNCLLDCWVNPMVVQELPALAASLILPSPNRQCLKVSRSACMHCPYVPPKQHKLPSTAYAKACIVQLHISWFRSERVSEALVETTSQQFRDAAAAPAAAAVSWSQLNPGPCCMQSRRSRTCGCLIGLHTHMQ
jgi:hypothetical protein